MPPVDDPAEQIESLRTRVEADPDDVDVEDVVRLVEPADVGERRRLVEIVDRKIAADPSAATELVAAVEPFFDHETDDVRTVAATIVEQVAGRYPERATPAVDHLADLVHDDYPFARRHAVWALAHVSDHEPDLVAPLVPEFRPGDDEPPYFEREHVVTILRNVATTDVEAITPLLPALLEVLESADDITGESPEDVRSPGMDGPVDQDRFKDPIDVPLAAAELVADVARAAPGELEPSVDELIGILESVDRRTVRREIADALGNLAEADPAVVEPAIPALGAQLDSRNAALQAQAARALGLAAETAPGAVSETTEGRVADLAPLLVEGTPPVQGSVAGLLSYVAEADPSIVEPALDELLSALDSETMFVRASASIALGYAGGEAARAALSDLLDDDLEPELSETVREAIDRIDARDGDRP